METIGGRLKEARLQKGVSIDHVARDTNISRKYIEAFEEEDFSIFPGDTYLIGFLTTYSDYLDLDASEIITLYKNIKIQEQPVPMEALTRPIRSFNIMPGLLIVLVLLVIGGGITLAVIFGGKGGPDTVKVVKDDKNTISYNGDIMEKVFHKGDVISLNQKGKTYKITVSAAGAVSVIQVGKTTVSVESGKPALIDVDNDGNFDAKIFFVALGVDDAKDTVTLRFNRDINAVETAANTQVADASGKFRLPESGLPSNTAWVVEPVVFKTADAVVPFNVSIVFSDNVYFRYMKDQDERSENMFARGSTMKFDSIAKNLVIWAANAKNVTMNIDGTDYIPGKAGEIAVRMIHWVKSDATGQYELRSDAVY